MSVEARIEHIGGILVLIDPFAAAVSTAVEQHNRNITRQNMRAFLSGSIERIIHFKQRIRALGRNHANTMIVLIDVDGGPRGQALANALMPGQCWQLFRDRGERPVARGLAEREGVQQLLSLAQPDVSSALHSLSAASGAAVLIVYRDTMMVAHI